MANRPANELTLAAAAEALAAGTLSSVALTTACLERIADREETVKAWAHIDPDQALAQAQTRDVEAQDGRRRSPMHGLPVAIKDIIDTCDMPTAYGSPIYAGHQPSLDAACVSLLRDAGAVILGKTHTTEFAALHPAVTRNPHNPAHTPGGSSAGSAASVGDMMAPAALGTQTFGSVIRPAAYCGTVGFKPTFGTINPAGVKPEGESLDTVGTFTRSAADLPLLLGALTRHAPADWRAGAPDFFRTPPKIAICRGPGWADAAPETDAVIDRAAAAWQDAGGAVTEIEVPAALEEALPAHLSVATYEMVRAFFHEWSTHREQISETLAPMLEAGEKVTLAEFKEANQIRETARATLAGILDGVDAVLTAAQPGEAPEGLGWTGNPVFNRVWTFLGVPCITLPVSTGPKGLPVGVQLIGPHGEDAALIALASWAEEALGT